MQMLIHNSKLQPYIYLLQYRELHVRHGIRTMIRQLGLCQLPLGLCRGKQLAVSLLRLRHPQRRRGRLHHSIPDQRLQVPVL